MEIQNKFQIGDKVKIQISEKIGTVTDLCVDDNSGKKVKYFVHYAIDDGKIEKDWFDDYQLFDGTF